MGHSYLLRGPRHRQVRFIEECFCQGQHLVVCDDNVASLQRAAPSDRRMPAALGPLDLPQQVLEARRQMQRHEAHLWGVSPTHNLIYVNHSPELKTGGSRYRVDDIYYIYIFKRVYI